MAAAELAERQLRLQATAAALAPAGHALQVAAARAAGTPVLLWRKAAQ